MGSVLIRHSVVEHRRVYMGRQSWGLGVRENVGKIGEADEMDERELVLVVSVKCGKEREMTRG